MTGASRQRVTAEITLRGAVRFRCSVASFLEIAGRKKKKENEEKEKCHDRKNECNEKLGRNRLSI
jgi:hypothetical protein